MVKTTFNVKNFSVQNTSKLANQIGNILLIVAGIGGVLVLAPVSSPTLVAIGAWAAFAGSLGKAITKMFGETDENNQPVSELPQKDVTPAP